MSANKKQTVVDQEAASQMLERVMRVAKLLAEQSENAPNRTAKQAQKTQPSRSAVE